jgi:hypothetical protein
LPRGDSRQNKWYDRARVLVLFWEVERRYEGPTLVCFAFAKGGHGARLVVVSYDNASAALRQAST